MKIQKRTIITEKKIINVMISQARAILKSECYIPQTTMGKQDQHLHHLHAIVRQQGDALSLVDAMALPQCMCEPIRTGIKRGVVHGARAIEQGKTVGCALCNAADAESDVHGVSCRVNAGKSVCGGCPHQHSMIRNRAPVCVRLQRFRLKFFLRS